MSTLSRHTKNLAQDPRASLLLTGRRERGDPLNWPRVTVGGLVKHCADPRAKVRYLQRNPKAGLYAGFADFSVFRLGIDDVHFNGGFGRAAPLKPTDVLASREGEAALTEAEERLIAEVNALGEPKLARLAGNKGSRPRWRAIGLDAEGLDLAAGGRAARAQFAAPAHDPEAWRARLSKLLAAELAGASIRSAPAAKVNANKTKEIQGNPSKKACISLDSFGGIRTFQWVTANPNKKSSF